VLNEPEKAHFFVLRTSQFASLDVSVSAPLLLFKAEMYLSDRCWRPRKMRFGVSPKKAAAMIYSGRYSAKIFANESVKFVVDVGEESFCLKFMPALPILYQFESKWAQ
jgi:hypothetical protein